MHTLKIRPCFSDSSEAKEKEILQLSSSVPGITPVSLWCESFQLLWITLSELEIIQIKKSNSVEMTNSSTLRRFSRIKFHSSINISMEHPEEKPSIYLIDVV